MLVCLNAGLFFWVHLSNQKMGIGSINTYLLNLIFGLFVLLYFLCLVLLECTCYRCEFSLLKQPHGTLLPQLSSFSLPVDGMMVQPFTGGVDQWQLESLFFLTPVTFLTLKMYFQSFLKLNSYFKIFFVICVSNCYSASLSSVYLNYLV